MWRILNDHAARHCSDGRNPAFGWAILWFSVAWISCAPPPDSTYHPYGAGGQLDMTFRPFRPNPAPVVASDSRSCARPWGTVATRGSQASARLSNCLDLMIIIKNSASADMPANASKSFLVAALQAVEVLLASFDKTTVAVGLVTTAVEPVPPPAPTPAAVATVVPLTNDYDAVRLGLERIRERGPSGRSNFPASIDQCTAELGGLGGSISSSTGEGRRAILLLENDVYGPRKLEWLVGEFARDDYGPFREPINENSLKSAADRARVAGIPLYVYILTFSGGAKELSELAQSTGGAVTVVRSPAKLNEAVSQFSVPEN